MEKNNDIKNKNQCNDLGKHLTDIQAQVRRDWTSFASVPHKIFDNQKAINKNISEFLIHLLEAANESIVLKEMARWEKAAIESNNGNKVFGLIKHLSKQKKEEYCKQLIQIANDGNFNKISEQINLWQISSKDKADICTELARQLPNKDSLIIAKLAEMAWQIDPKPYRLKWLAFRTYDAGKKTKAYAMLAHLSDEVNFTESERNRAEKIKKEGLAYYQKKSREIEESLSSRENVLGGLNARIDQLESKLKLSEIERSKLLKREPDKELTELNSLLFTQLSKVQDELGRYFRRFSNYEKLGTVEKLQNALKIMEEFEQLKNNYEEAKREVENLKEALLKKQDEINENEVKYNGYLEDAMNQMLDEKENSIRLKTELDAAQKTLEEKVNEISEIKEREVKNNIRLEEAQSLLNDEKENCIKLKAELETVHTILDDKINGNNEIKKYFSEELDNVLRQSIAYQAISEYFSTGNSQSILTWKRGYPASPDFIQYLIKLLSVNNYDLILEFGSGYTTLYIAKTLALLNSDVKKIAEAVSFEHHDRYYIKTKKLLNDEGMQERIKLIMAPLHEWQGPDDKLYNYYSCQDTLQQLSENNKDNQLNILVIVDGPPGSSCKNARYPAFPLVMKYFPAANIDFLLDDYQRDDEKEVAQVWTKTCQMAGIPYDKHEMEFEHGCVLLKVRRSRPAICM